ncbi:MAG: hypothetical protein EOO65_06025 [Methanosarcinales archaeon]|nr:MAG: hypothetical protein EOO65_06025 [Methanosarcinales archaeon]
MTAEVAELEKTADTLTAKCDELESSEKARFAADEERHQAEVAKLKMVNDQLKESLESLLVPQAAVKK